MWHDTDTIWYRYGDTEKFAKFPIQYGRNMFKKLNLKLNIWMHNI